ncbi:MAG: DUF4290 domain-containing protein [Flavobacteriales bacterium]|nr:DUF4290 domain-containing protein [Flavobacteriales bacterium]MCX7768579.1 DUF4290 domain-containing protein [Flavobacteriales bacterium]MDW8409767.1 DUF4290 domain-containing protein [Flavobacteriales bacterium]
MAKALEYNTERPYLVNREFGRNVQKLAEFITTLPDPETRLRNAEALIRIMQILVPSSKEDDNYLQKLWDHLHMIAHFELDVQSPFPKPDPAKPKPKCVKPSYPRRQMRYGQYGNLIERLIDYAASLPEGPERDYLTELAANFMKKSYLTWNKDTINDDMIKVQLEQLSNGRLQLRDDHRLSSTRELLLQTRNQPDHDSSELFPPKKKKKKKKRR